MKINRWTVYEFFMEIIRLRYNPLRLSAALNCPESSTFARREESLRDTDREVGRSGVEFLLKHKLSSVRSLGWGSNWRITYA